MPIYSANVSTLGDLVEALAVLSGDLVSVRDAKATAGTPTTLTDTVNLQDADDTRFKGRWLYLKAGPGAGDVRVVTDFAASVLTAPAFSATPTTSTRYLVTNRPPHDYINAIQQAQRLIGGLWNFAPLVDRSIIWGSPILNGMFDVWDAGADAAPTHWTATGAGLASAKETAITIGGLASYKMSGATGTGVARQVIAAGPHRGLPRSVKARVYTRSAPGDATLRLQCRNSMGVNVGATQTVSPTALGWQSIETAAYVIPDAAADIAVDLLQTALGGEIYWWGVHMPALDTPWYQFHSSQRIVHLNGLIEVLPDLANASGNYDYPVTTIQPDGWSTLLDGTDRITIDRRPAACHPLRFTAWQSHAELTAATTAWTGSMEALLWRAMQIIWQSRAPVTKESLAAADNYRRMADQAQDQFSQVMMGEVYAPKRLGRGMN